MGCGGSKPATAGAFPTSGQDLAGTWFSVEKSNGVPNGDRYEFRREGNCYFIIRPPGGAKKDDDRFTFDGTTGRHIGGPTNTILPNGDLHWDHEGGKWVSRREGGAAPPSLDGHYFSFQTGGNPAHVVDRFEARQEGQHRVTYYRNGPVGSTTRVDSSTANAMESYELHGRSLLGAVSATVKSNGDIEFSHGYTSRKEMESHVTGAGGGGGSSVSGSSGGDDARDLEGMWVPTRHAEWTRPHQARHAETIEIWDAHGRCEYVSADEDRGTIKVVSRRGDEYTCRGETGYACHVRRMVRTTHGDGTASWDLGDLGVEHWRRADAPSVVTVTNARTHEGHGLTPGVYRSHTNDEYNEHDFRVTPEGGRYRIDFLHGPTKYPPVMHADRGPSTITFPDGPTGQIIDGSTISWSASHGLPPGVTWQLAAAESGGSSVGGSSVSGSSVSGEETITIRMTADDWVDEVHYNGENLSGRVHNMRSELPTLKTVTFKRVPGAVLAIAAHDTQSGRGASKSFWLHSQSTNPASPWNFGLDPGNAPRYCRAFGTTGPDEEPGHNNPRPAHANPPEGWFQNGFDDAEWGLPDGHNLFHNWEQHGGGAWETHKVLRGPRICEGVWYGLNKYLFLRFSGVDSSAKGKAHGDGGSSALPVPVAMGKVVMVDEEGTGSGTGTTILIDMVDILKRELRLEGNVSQVVAAACEQLGLSMTGKTLVDQATECCRVMGCA